VMLVTKYVKVLSRTGTLSSHLGCCFRLDFGPATQADVSNFRPTGTPTQVSPVQSSQAFLSPTGEGQRNGKKIYRSNGLSKEVSGRLAPAGIHGCSYALDVALGRHQQIRRPLLNHSGIQSKGFIVAQHRYDMVTVDSSIRARVTSGPR